MRAAAMGIACFWALSATAEIWTITVPAGETKDLKTCADALFAEKGHEFAPDDIIEKYGEGRLVSTNLWKTVTLGLRVKEGVWEARVLGDLLGGNFVTVSSGASVLVNNKATNGSAMCNYKTFYLNGHGHADAVVNGVTGALVFGGNENYEVMNRCTFELQSDATIALGLARQFGMFTYGIINQNGHKLTLLGGGHTLGSNGNTTGLYQLRFRYGYGFTNTAEIVVDGGALVAHNTTYWARPNKVPLCTVKNRGAFGPDGQSFADCFALVSFEPGTFIASAGASTITLPPLEGCPFICANVTPTINKAWTVRADEIATGVSLGARKTLTFGSSATLAVKNLDQLDAGTSYVVATSFVSVAGMPTFTSNVDEAKLWKTVATDSKTISLAYDIPAGVVNVRDWGVLPGAANAVANDAAFATGLANLTGTGNVVFFPQGQYYFSSPVGVSAASGVTLLGDNGWSMLRVTDPAATSILSVTGGSDVTVTGLGFADCAGVAVAASGTANLTVTNNVFTNVVGAVSGVDGTYPVSAADCTDLYVKDNRVRGGAAYTKLAYVSGTTTKKEGSEPDSGELEFFVYAKEGESRTERFPEVFARFGLAEYPADTTLVKTGLGRFYGTNDIAIRDRIKQIVVREGTYVGTHADAWGRKDSSTGKSYVKVEDGATALIEGSGDALSAQHVTFEVGRGGAATSGGGYSLAFRSPSWRITYYCRFVLRSDTFFGKVDETQAGVFSQSTTEQNGHTLVLKGMNINSDYRFRENHTFRSPGPIYVTNATVSASYADNTGWKCPDGKPPLISFGSGSRFMPDTQAFCNVFDLYEFASGAIFTCRSNNTLRVSRLKGSPTVNLNVTLTVGRNYIARASDLLANKHITAKSTLIFAPDCTADVEDAESLLLTDTGYVLATSDVAISGRPKKSLALMAAGWTTSLSSDGKTLRLIPVGGTTIFVR
ncbi:MAG: hypothetical protein IJJ84_03840 [Kiritimatiellae bacterium]|nr:hypothetical protein [Kiritimatiellia bacterium]